MTGAIELDFGMETPGLEDGFDEEVDEDEQGEEGTHRGDPASGRGGGNGTARLPQSVPKHYEREDGEVRGGFSSRER